MIRMLTHRLNTVYSLVHAFVRNGVAHLLPVLIILLLLSLVLFFLNLTTPLAPFVYSLF